MKITNFVLAVLAASAAALTPIQVSAQDYPNRAMEWIVPAPAGGGTDTAARQLAKIVEADLGEPIAIINVAGGGGAVGVSQFVQSKPDGYTLAAVWNGPITTVPNVQNVPYSPDDYVPIVSTSETAYTLCVKPDFPAKTGKELLRVLKDHPEKYTYGNDGIGNTMQLAAERMFKAFGAKATAIPFGGAGETLQNFLGGHVDIYGGSISPVIPYVKNGQAKCLIVTSKDPIGALPDAASMSELGHPELAAALWRAILGLKGMDPERVKIIADAVSKAMTDKAYIAFLDTKGEQPAVMTGDELKARLSDEYKSFGEAAQALGLKN